MGGLLTSRRVVGAGVIATVSIIGLVRVALDAIAHKPLGKSLGVAIIGLVLAATAVYLRSIFRKE